MSQRIGADHVTQLFKCLGLGKRRRPKCKYGADCYRTNPDHFINWDHPMAKDGSEQGEESDSDSDSDDASAYNRHRRSCASQTRSRKSSKKSAKGSEHKKFCAYGAYCGMMSEEHNQRYRHPRTCQNDGNCRNTTPGHRDEYRHKVEEKQAMTRRKSVSQSSASAPRRKSVSQLSAPTPRRKSLPPPQEGFLQLCPQAGLRQPCPLGPRCGLHGFSKAHDGQYHHQCGFANPLHVQFDD
jgi:hypothetical protein